MCVKPAPSMAARASSGTNALRRVVRVSRSVQAAARERESEVERETRGVGEERRARAAHVLGSVVLGTPGAKQRVGGGGKRPPARSGAVMR